MSKRKALAVVLLVLLFAVEVTVFFFRQMLPDIQVWMLRVVSFAVYGAAIVIIRAYNMRPRRTRRPPEKPKVEKPFVFPEAKKKKDDSKNSDKKTEEAAEDVEYRPKMPHDIPGPRWKRVAFWIGFVSLAIIAVAFFIDNSSEKPNRAQEEYQRALEEEFKERPALPVFVKPSHEDLKKDWTKEFPRPELPNFGDTKATVKSFERMAQHLTALIQQTQYGELNEPLDDPTLDKEKAEIRQKIRRARIYSFKSNGQARADWTALEDTASILEAKRLKK